MHWDISRTIRFTLASCPLSPCAQSALEVSAPDTSRLACQLQHERLYAMLKVRTRHSRGKHVSPVEVFLVHVGGVFTTALSLPTTVTGWMAVLQTFLVQFPRRNKYTIVFATET